MQLSIMPRFACFVLSLPLIAACGATSGLSVGPVRRDDGGAPRDGGMDGSTDGEADGGMPPLPSSQWVAYTLFVSTTSARSRLMLLRYKVAGATPIELLDGPNAGFVGFSADRRWLAVHSGTTGGANGFVIDVSGDQPGPYLPINDVGLIRTSNLIAWSPDGTRIAYVLAGSPTTLWIGDVTPAGVTNRVQVASGIAPSVLAWPVDGLLTFRDTQARATVVRVLGGVASPATTFALPDSHVRAVSPDGARVLILDEDGAYHVGDTGTGATTTLPGVGTTAWHAPRDFSVLLGHRYGDAAYAIHAVNGLALGAALYAASDVEPFFVPHFARAHDALAIAESSRARVVDFSGAAVTSVEVPGAYGDADVAGFAHDDGAVIFVDEQTVWATTLDTSAPRQAVPLTTFPARPEVALAPGSPRLLASAGTPVDARLVVLGGATPEVRDYSLGLNWIEPEWSPGTHLTIIGASPSTGRALYLIDSNAPIGTARLLSACTTNNSSPPACPNTVRFQP